MLDFVVTKDIIPESVQFRSRKKQEIKREKFTEKVKAKNCKTTKARTNVKRRKKVSDEENVAGKLP